MGGFPKPGEIRGDVPGRHSREGWLHVADHNSVSLQGKQYRDMKEWSRPCAVCGTKFSVFEKSGTVDANSRFSNRTCDAHRNLLPAVEKGYIVWSASHGGMIAGTACVGSVAGTAVQDGADVEALKKENKEYAEAIIENLADIGRLKRELTALKATHELQPAMQLVTQEQADAAAARILSAEPVQHVAFDPHALLAAEIARKPPWE